MLFVIGEGLLIVGGLIRLESRISRIETNLSWLMEASKNRRTQNGRQSNDTAH